VASRNVAPVRTFCFDHFTVEKSNCCQNKKYGDSKADQLQRAPFSKRMFLDKRIYYVAIQVVQTCIARILPGKFDVSCVKRSMFMSQILATVCTHSGRPKQHLEVNTA